MACACIVQFSHSRVHRLQLMSFPGTDAQAEPATPGAAGVGGAKAGEESIAPSGSVFAVLQAYATHVFAPTVRAYAATRGGDDKVRVNWIDKAGVGGLSSVCRVGERREVHGVTANYANVEP